MMVKVFPITATMLKILCLFLIIFSKKIFRLNQSERRKLVILKKLHHQKNFGLNDAGQQNILLDRFIIQKVVVFVHCVDFR